MADAPTTRPTAPSAFVAGQLISNRYELEHRIASGGMAEVWQARDGVLNRHVAVKILHPHLAADSAFVARFRSEAVAAARLHHPNIVAIYDTCHDDRAEAIVMELVRGTTLRDQLDGRGFLDPPEVVHIGGEVADALESAHRAGLVHRDIKPGNILLCADQRVMVTDFGIAKVRDDPDMTQTGTMLGTVKYLAPEQVRSQPVDGRTDVYALGVVMYESLCARPPFVGDTPAATALARLHQDPPRPTHLRPSIPVGLEAVVMRCLARDPDDRYQSAADVRAALAEPSVLAGDDLTIAADPGIHVGPASMATDRDATNAWTNAAVMDAAAVGGDVDDARHGPWLRPVLATIFVLGALVIAFALLDQAGVVHRLLSWGDQHAAGPATPSSSVPPGPVTIRTVESFDPEGSGPSGENDSQLPRAIDGNPATGWATESYNDRHFGNLKKGVGLIIDLGASTPVRQLRVTSPTTGWAAQVYASDAATAPGTLAGWGASVTSHQDISGDATFDVSGHHGRYLLLWITDLGDGPPLVRTQIDELSVSR